MCLDGALIAELLAGDRQRQRQARVLPHRRASRIARATGHRAIAVEGDGDGVPGHQLARRAGGRPSAALQQRLRAAALAAGVSMADPDTVWLSADTQLAADVTIGPNVRFGPAYSVASRTDDQGVLRHRGRAHRPRRHHRPVRPHPAGLGRGRGRPYRQLRRAQGRPGWPWRQGQSSRPISAILTSARRPTSALATIAVNYDGYGKWRTDRSVPRPSSAPTASLVAPVQHRPRRQRHRRQRDHRGRAGRRRGLRARPPGHKAAARRPASCETEGASAAAAKRAKKK